MDKLGYNPQGPGQQIDLEKIQERLEKVKRQFHEASTLIDEGRFALDMVMRDLQPQLAPFGQRPPPAPETDPEPPGFDTERPPQDFQPPAPTSERRSVIHAGSFRKIQETGRYGAWIEGHGINIKHGDPVQVKSRKGIEQFHVQKIVFEGFVKGRQMCLVSLIEKEEGT